MFASVTATPAEIAAPMPGDDLLPDPDVVLDRAFTVAATPTDVWPWIVQLGKGRAGWYLPRRIERVLPARFRAVRAVDDRWQAPAVGDIVPDYGPGGYFEIAQIEAPRTLVHRARRGSVELTWSIALDPAAQGGTRVRLRLALHPVRRQWLARSLGDAFDAATVAGMAAGLSERLHG